jgi:general secretion pathway protein E/type IV pilus assembly protein PilB
MMAQRLVRKLCPKCTAPHEYTENQLRSIGIDPAAVEEPNYQKGKGCSHCTGTGHRGRFGIFEIFVVEDEARKLIYDKVPASVLRKAAREMGMKTLREDGARKVTSGLTTVEEVVRATANE